MKQDDWKRMIEAWRSSRKHNELKKKLKSRRMYRLNTTEIISIIEGIFEFSELSDEDKEAFDWLDIDFQETITKSDLIQSLIESLMKWHFYLYKYELKQEYELCARLRDVITIEIEECKRMVKTYFFIEEGDDALYAELRKNTKQSVLDNYFDWIELINEQEEE